VLQFIFGFACGCIVTCLAFYCIYLYRKKSNTVHSEHVQETKQKSREQVLSFLAPEAKILLVDDSRLSRTVIKEFFWGTKVDIIEAGNGAECLKLAKSDRFDMILLDLMMPGMDGLETLRRLQGGLNKETPVIAVSSGIRRENEKNYEEMGFVGCLGKPISAKRMEEVMLRYLPREKVFRRPDGFSYESGLKNFDGNEKAYQETLVLFADLWNERQGMLQQFLEEENMAEYAILIHAIKGDARTLGATILGKLAYEQELKAKEGDAEAVRSSFEKVITTGRKTAEFFFAAFSK